MDDFGEVEEGCIEGDGPVWAALEALFATWDPWYPEINLFENGEGHLEFFGTESVRVGCCVGEISRRYACRADDGTRGVDDGGAKKGLSVVQRCTDQPCTPCHADFLMNDNRGGMGCHGPGFPSSASWFCACFRVSFGWYDCPCVALRDHEDRTGRASQVGY